MPVSYNWFGLTSVAVFKSFNEFRKTKIKEITQANYKGQTVSESRFMLVKILIRRKSGASFFTPIV